MYYPLLVNILGFLKGMILELKDDTPVHLQWSDSDVLDIILNACLAYTMKGCFMKRWYVTASGHGDSIGDFK